MERVQNSVKGGRLFGWFDGPGVGEGALQYQGGVRNTLGAYVAQKLADAGMAANLRHGTHTHRNQFI